MNKILKQIVFFLLPFVVFAQQKEVLHRAYFKDGSLQQEWFLKNNLPYKYWRTFYQDKKQYYERTYDENGKLNAEGWLLNGKKYGFWKEFI